jgi:hypothetical protein
MVCGPVKPPDHPAPNEPPQPDKKKRVRRWHHRGFTGCSTCRRRHVRCDEASPTCKNCTRLGLECDGSQGRMTFKVYGAPPTADHPLTAPKKREKSAPRSSHRRAKEDSDHIDGVVVSPATATKPKLLIFQFENPVSSVDVADDNIKVKREVEEDMELALVPTTVDSTTKALQYIFVHYKPSVSSLDCLEGRYYTHFVEEVATLLLIYDNSTNVNPFRRCFPDVSQSSPSMANAMEALGALHLANTSTGQQRILHFQHAIGKYGEVVKSFRTRYNQGDQGSRLPDFATCLLLALYEVRQPPIHCSNILTLVDDGLATS